MSGMTPFSLEEKRILVTGASSGIGRATAIECASAGASVIINGRDKERLSDTFSNLERERHTHLMIQGDLTDANIVDEICKGVGQLDGAVLCAGKVQNVPFSFMTREKIDDIFEVNFYSQVELMRMLYKRKVLKKGASVVVVASIGGIYKYAFGNAIYGASKSALNSMVKYAAREFAGRYIRVNSICPGMVETPLITDEAITTEQHAKNMAEYPLGRYGKPEEIAYGAVYLLSDAASWVTGQQLVIDGGRTIS